MEACVRLRLSWRNRPFTPSPHEREMRYQLWSMRITTVATVVLVVLGAVLVGCAPATSRPPTATTGSGPMPEVGAAHGHMDPAAIQRVVRADFDAMRACYDRGVARKPNLRGRVTTFFVIERDGSVSSAAPTPKSYTPSPGTPPGQAPANVVADAQPLDDEEVSSCIAARFGALRFPAPEGGSVKVNYPIIFSP